MNFSFGAGATPAAGGSTGFSFGSTPAATTTAAAATGSSFSFDGAPAADQVDAPGYREVQSGEHQDPGALCRPPGQGEGVRPVTKIFQHCYKNISRYDLEANLALLKLYQFNPTYNNLTN